MKRIHYFIPGGFISFLLAYFIRLWAIEHGYGLLAVMAAIYMIIILLPLVLFAAFLAIMLLVVLAVWLMSIMFIKR